MSLAIETIPLTRRFNGLVAVKEIDLQVASGAVFGLFGPNGAGKSTAIKMLTEVYRMTGSVRRARIREALEFSGLHEVSAKLVKIFSGGMAR